MIEPIEASLAFSQEAARVRATGRSKLRDSQGFRIGLPRSPAAGKKNRGPQPRRSSLLFFGSGGAVGGVRLLHDFAVTFFIKGRAASGELPQFILL